jgi:hypothetical protein
VKIGDLVVPRGDALGRAFIEPPHGATTTTDWNYTKRGDLYVYIGQMTIVNDGNYKNISILWSIKDLKIVHLYENEIEACLASEIL